MADLQLIVIVSLNNGKIIPFSLWVCKTKILYHKSTEPLCFKDYPQSVDLMNSNKNHVSAGSICNFHHKTNRTDIIVLNFNSSC